MFENQSRYPEVRQVVEEHSAFDVSILRIKAWGPPLSKKIVVKFIISPKGNVKSAESASSTAADKELECVVKAVSRWKFPPPKGGGVVVVNYPFVFKTTE